MKKLMGNNIIKKLLFVFVLLGLTCFWGCAKTLSDDIFRFEVRSLNITVGDSFEIGMVLGGVDENTKIVFETAFETVDEEGNAVITSGSEYLNVKGNETTNIEMDTIGKATDKIVLTGLKAGTVSLTATSLADSKITDTIYVTVSNEKLTGLKATCTKDQLVMLEEGSFTVESYPSNLPSEVTYKSTNPEVVEINEQGQYKALKVGQVDIIITSVYDPSVAARKTITVNYNDAQEVTVEQDSFTIIKTETAQIVSHVLPNEEFSCAEDKVTFESSDTTVATVDATGLIKAVEAGECVITVTSIDGKASKEVNVVVEYATVESIKVSTEEETLNSEDTVVIKGTVSPSNANPKAVFTSSDESVATVDENGKVTAVGSGVAVIKVAAAGDEEIYKEVTISVLGKPEVITVKTTTLELKANTDVNIIEALEVVVGPGVCDQSVKFEYKNPAGKEVIASLDQKGNMFVMDAGTVTLTIVSTVNPEVSVEITVVVTE